MKPRIKGQNNLWKYRRRAKLSQVEVARLLGLRSAARISDWERGVRLPGLVNAVKLAYVLNTFVLELFPNLVAFAQEAVIREREAGLGRGNR